MSNIIQTLPALRSLGDLRDTVPTILIDQREQAPLTFLHFPSQPATLQTGDYSFTGGEELFSVERKTIPDLINCCMGDNRLRFARELHRLRGYRFKRILIIGSEQQVLDGDYRSNIKPKAILGTLNASEIRYDSPVVWTPTPEAAALLLERWAFYTAREIVAMANQLRRSTPDSRP